MLPRALCLACVLSAPSFTASPAFAQEGTGAAAKPPATLDPKQLAERLDAHILKNDLGQFWGQVLVARGGEIILAKGYGLANNSLRALDSRTLMDVGSISKQFTAAAILKLEMQGKLSTDDKVSKFFPDAGGAADRITLYQLLTHTSGLSDEKGAIQSLAFPDRDRAVSLAMKSKLKHDPGEAFDYCNGGYVVLGAVVERASGAKFEDYLRDTLFTPAGMGSTGFLDGQKLDLSNAAARVIEGKGEKGTQLGILNDGWGWGFKGCGGVLTNVHDLLAWDRALRGDAILDDVAKAKYYNPALGGYALGWFIEGDSTRGRRAHHSGSTRGFVAELSRDLEQDLVVAVLTNGRNDPVGLAGELRELALGREDHPSTLLRTKGLALDEHGMVSITGDAVLTATATPHGILVKIANRKAPDSTIVETVIPRETAKMIVHELPIAIKWGEKSRVGKDIPAGADLVVTTTPYTANADGAFPIPDAATWMPYPWYRSELGEDPRPTLVLMDKASGFWPVILKMHPDEAERVAAAIRAALD